jgi:hypothetical protein
MKPGNTGDTHAVCGHLDRVSDAMHDGNRSCDSHHCVSYSVVSVSDVGAGSAASSADTPRAERQSLGTSRENACSCLPLPVSACGFEPNHLLG